MFHTTHIFHSNWKISLHAKATRSILCCLSMQIMVVFLLNYQFCAFLIFKKIILMFSRVMRFTRLTETNKTYNYVNIELRAHRKVPYIYNSTIRETFDILQSTDYTNVTYVTLELWVISAVEWLLLKIFQHFIESYKKKRESVS